jgi:NhaP-type Na+/H+ or K+/H+ antiporter
MPRRMAGVLALIAFAVCLVVGGLQTGNTFTTTVTRALVAMAGTFVIGLVIGGIGQRMLEENLDGRRKSEFSEAISRPEDR